MELKVLFNISGGHK